MSSNRQIKIHADSEVMKKTRSRWADEIGSCTKNRRMKLLQTSTNRAPNNLASVLFVSFDHIQLNMVPTHGGVNCTYCISAATT
jgi:hypothetical protein